MLCCIYRCKHKKTSYQNPYFLIVFRSAFLQLNKTIPIARNKKHFPHSSQFVTDTTKVYQQNWCKLNIKRSTKLDISIIWVNRRISRTEAARDMRVIILTVFRKLLYLISVLHVKYDVPLIVVFICGLFTFVNTYTSTLGLFNHCMNILMFLRY